MTATHAKFYDVAWQPRVFPTPAIGPGLDELRVHLSIIEPLLRTAELYAEDPLVPQAERDEWIRLARRLQRPADGTA